MSSAYVEEKQTLTGVISGEQGVTVSFVPSVGPKGDTGPAGPTGPQGPTGEPGHTPKRGVDYWTAEDISDIQSYIDTQLGVIENGSY